MSSGAREGLALVVPAYRAAAALPRVLARVRSAVPAAAVFVVDDGSDDGGATADAAAASGAVVLRHGGNLGKGRALRTGLAAAAASGAWLIVTLDADGQHPPEAIPLLVEPVLARRADLVVGARERGGGPMPVGRRITNRLSSALVSRALGVRVPDSQSGFRAMRREVAERVRPAGARYEFETEFLFLAARHGYRIAAVRVPTVYEGARSHFRHGADTLAIAAVFLRHWHPILAGGAAKT